MIERTWIIEFCNSLNGWLPIATYGTWGFGAGMREQDSPCTFTLREAMVTARDLHLKELAKIGTTLYDSDGEPITGVQAEPWTLRIREKGSDDYILADIL